MSRISGVLLLSISTFISVHVHCLYDETLVERASGPGVVDAVCEKMDSSCIFPDDKMMLRRIAYVESNDGIDGSTYAQGYCGGIWKVDETMFMKTRSLSQSLQLDIQSEFNIAWDNVTWNDLLKPFYSGLAARIFLSLVSSDIPRSVEDQANLWSLEYRKTDQASTYMNKAINLNTGCNNSVADIVFVVDGSGSIGYDNFDKVKIFLKKFIATLNIGPDPYLNSRISVVQFSSIVQVEFKLNDYSTLEEYQTAIGNIVYLSQGTQTDKALDYLATQSFLPSSGARPAGVSKIGIVMTDGASNNFFSTLTAADRLHKKDITVIAVGIGSYLNSVELRAIATDPDCKNVFYLNGFFDLDALKETVEKKTCEAPIYISEDPIRIYLYANETKNVKITVPSCGLAVEISGGDGIAYFSNDTYPTSSFHELKFDISEFIPAVVYFPGNPAALERYVFCRIESRTINRTSYEIETSKNESLACNANPCPTNKLCVPRKHFSFECIEDFSYNSTTQKAADGFNCDNKNPCNTSNSASAKLYFPSENASKFVQCIKHGECHVISCPDGLFWSAQTETCARDLNSKQIVTTDRPKKPEEPSHMSFYNCAESNPCTAANAALEKFYFPHKNSTLFVQCSEWQQCYVIPCPVGLVWNQLKYTCYNQP